MYMHSFFHWLKTVYRFLYGILIIVKKLLIDIGIISVSIYVAIYLVQAGAVDALLHATGDNLLLVSFISGIFFTSFFTTPVSIAMFSSLAHDGNIFLIAGMGALGSVVGDFILFWFVRHHIAKDASALMKGPKWKRILRVLRKRRFRRVLPVIGALIIASPFPDEIGLALIGVSTINQKSFFLLSYIMNLLGILIILLIASVA